MTSVLVPGARASVVIAIGGAPYAPAVSREALALAQVVQALEGESPSEVVGAVTTEVQQFAATGLADDLCVVAARIGESCCRTGLAPSGIADIRAGYAL